jgi:hypothetical protein
MTAPVFFLSLDMYNQIYIQHMGRLLTTWKTNNQVQKPLAKIRGSTSNMTELVTNDVYPNRLTLG